MSPTLLPVLVVLYLVGVIILSRRKSHLIRYMWGAFGFAAMGVLATQSLGWYKPLGSFQANILTSLGQWVQLNLENLESSSILVPTPEGWSVLKIGVECSAIIEASIFAGLLLFYPRISPGSRALRLVFGLAATFLINLGRLGVIVAIVATFGSPAVPWAHAVIGRLLFFFGIVAVYWWIFTLPTIRTIREDIGLHALEAPASSGTV